MKKVSKQKENTLAGRKDGPSARDMRWPGQSLVELAVMLPLLTLILVGTIDLGRVFFSYARLTNAVKEGALYGGYSPWNTATGTADVSQRAYDEAQGQLGTTGAGNDFEVTVTCYDAVTKLPKSACGPITDSSAAKSGDVIEVRGTYKFRPITSYIIGIWGTPLTIRNSARMMIQ